MDDPRYHVAIKQALRSHVAFRFINLLLAFGFQIIVVKVLTPENYATYAVLLATLIVGERLLSFGIDRTILRFVPAFILRKDHRGLQFLAKRLGLLRVAGLILFVLALTASSELQLRITPGELSTTTTLAFGAWFFAYTLLADADVIAQSLIAHRAAALVAACETFLRFGILSLMCFFSRMVDVEMVVIVCAATSSVALAGLLCSIWLSAHRRVPTPGMLPSHNEFVAAAQRHAPTFALAAYASMASWLVSSPGVIRLIATTGLNVITLAAFSFIQGLSMSLPRALPGQLILPSLEPIFAQMADSGRGDRIFPSLSLLFKIELTCILAIIIGTEIAGPELIKILSRPEYAPYYYILPILMVGLCFHTIYRVLEILGSVILKYKIFLTLWPLSVVAIVALYFTVGRWGLISVLVVPIMEIMARVAILVVAFRRHGVWKALDPVRSLRLVFSALIVLFCSSYALDRYGEVSGNADLLVAVGDVIVFFSTLFIIRPLNMLEYETLSKIFPASWGFPRYIARRLSHL